MDTENRMGSHKTQRTQELRQAAERYVIAEEVQNHIEQHNFDRLVRNGVIIEAQTEGSMLYSEGAGSGEAGVGDAVSTCQSLKY